MIPNDYTQLAGVGFDLGMLSILFGAVYVLYILFKFRPIPFIDGPPCVTDVAPRAMRDHELITCSELGESLGKELCREVEREMSRRGIDNIDKIPTLRRAQ